MIPHLDNPNHPDASMANAQSWAAKLPVPTYAIDDATAGVARVESASVWQVEVHEGPWRVKLV